MFPLFAFGLLAVGGWWIFGRDEERHVPRPPIPDPSDPDNPSKDKTPPLVRLAIPREGAANDDTWRVANVPAEVAHSVGGDVIDLATDGPLDVLVSLPGSVEDYWMKTTDDMEQLSPTGSKDVLFRFTGTGQLELHVTEDQATPDAWADFIVNVEMQ